MGDPDTGVRRWVDRWDNGLVVLSRVRRGEPVNSSQQGGLARAVRSDNPQRLPAGNLHVHAAQCPRFAPGVFLGPHGPVQHLQQRVVAAGADA